MRPLLVALTAGSLVACGSRTTDLTINGSGSTFQLAFQEVAIETYTSAHHGIRINYGGGGSGKGRQDFADLVTDFGCTDAPYKDSELAKLEGGAFIYVPVLLGAVTVSYNLDGIPALQLSADTLAKIFQREITRWNDAAIAADNPGVTLPATRITVAHRSDGSGTTQNFTKYLETAASGTWKLKSGSTVEWSSDTQAGNGNSGVAQIVKSTRGAIGYVDLPDAAASGLRYARIRNSAGTYVEPTAASARAAGDGIAVRDDLIFSPLNAPGAAAYPITMPTWCMAYVRHPDPAKAAAVKAYFRYMVTDGQTWIPELDYAPLPKALQEQALAAVESLEGG